MNSNLTLSFTGTGGPSEVKEGRDALLTCVVMAPYYNDTIIWRKGPREILSAGMNRVTSDKRISILHEDCKSPLSFGSPLNGRAKHLTNHPFLSVLAIYPCPLSISSQWSGASWRGCLGAIN